MSEEISRSERKRSDTPCIPPIDSRYWPEIRELIFADPAQVENIKGECEICYLPLSTDRNNDSEDVCPGISILACGHIFGRQCLLDYLSTEQITLDERFYPDSCPACRKNLIHQECGHLALIPFLSNVDDLKRNLKSKCLGADGGLLAGKCAPCSLALKVVPLAFQIRDALSEEDREFAENAIMMTLGDSWGNQWLFYTRDFKGETRRAGCWT